MSEKEKNSKSLLKYIQKRFLVVIISFTVLFIAVLMFILVYLQNNKEKTNIEKNSSYSSSNIYEKELLDSSTMNEYVLELNAANAAVDAGEYEEAIEAYKEAIEIAPREEAAYIGLANAYKYMGDVQKANDVLLRAFEETGIESLKKHISSSAK